MDPTAPSTGVVADLNQGDELEDLEGISVKELNQVRFEQGQAGTPAGAQQESDDEAEKWAKHWGTGREWEPLQ